MFYCIFYKYLIKGQRMKKLLAVLLLVPVLAFAWEPTKPITVISPVAPGAGNEMSFRAVSSIIERAGKATFIVESKPGADNVIGINHLAEQPANGYHAAAAACQSTFVASDVHSNDIIKFTPIYTFLNIIFFNRF